MKEIIHAQRVSIPSGGFYLRGVIAGKFSQTSKVVEEIEENLFMSDVGLVFRVMNWWPPSKPTSDYEIIPADWPTSKKVQENIT